MYHDKWVNHFRFAETEAAEGTISIVPNTSV